MVGVTRAQRLASVRRDDEACLYKAWLHTMTANTGNVEESSTRYVGTAVGMAINDAPVTELKKCAVKRQKQCPFGGMTRSMPVQGMAAHHDRKHCEGCDFLGRFCITNGQPGRRRDDRQPRQADRRTGRRAGSKEQRTDGHRQTDGQPTSLVLRSAFTEKARLVPEINRAPRK